MAQRGLGKGMESLIGSKKEGGTSASKKNTKQEDAEVKLNINDIEPNRNQPRKNFDEDNLTELAESIKQYGVIQPLIVKRKGKRYEIVAGERRWRASKLAGLKEVPVIVKDYTDREVMEIALIENIQREDLNPIEEALAFQNLIDEFHLKQEELAQRVSKNRSTITNSLRLLKLSARVQEMLIEDVISSGHARALLAIEDEEKQFELATKVMDEALSVRETEKLIKNLNNKKPEKTNNNEQEIAIYQDLEEKMKSVLGTKVNIRKKGKKGSIEIEYYSEDELDRIIDLIMSLRGK